MISTVIIAKNEEVNIQKCIKSVSFSDEIIVVDNGSSDKTKNLARKHKTRIISAKGISDFSTLRNIGLKEAKFEWILFIDSDEIVTEELEFEIQQATQKSKYCAYYLKRRDFWHGKLLKYGDLKSAYTKGIIRLVKKDSGIWNGRVHETFHAKCKIGYLQGFIDHYSHKNICEFISKINLYSNLRAKELFENRVNINLVSIITIPIIKFIYSYIILFGFLDGTGGFVYSFTMSLHSFLVRSKLYLLNKYK